MKKTGQNGYIAISSVLVIMVVVMIIGTSVSLLSINDIQLSLSNKKSDEALDLVEGCVEDALIRLNEDNLIPATITIPQGACSVTINSQAGSNWTFTVTGTFNTYTKGVRVEAVRQSNVEVSSWTEI